MAEPNMEENYYLSLLKRRGFSVLIIVTVFYILLIMYSDAKHLLKYLQDIDIRFVFFILLSISASFLIKSIRQLFLLKAIDIRLSFSQNLVLYLAGLSMTITPASLGQMIKSYYLHKYYGQSISRTIPIILVERYNDVFALFSFIAIFVVTDNIVVLRAPTLIIGIVLAFIMLIVKNHSLFRFFHRYLVKVSIFKKLEKSSYELEDSLSLQFRNSTMTYSWLLSIFAWFFEAIGIFLCFEALNFNLHFGLTTAYGFSSVLFGAISFIPGGAGIAEIIFIHLLSNYGYDISRATAVVLLVRLSTLWYSTLIGIIATKFILKK